MDFTLTNIPWSTLLIIVLVTTGTYIILIIFSRIFGLRSFSKMSGFDFVVTIALGSMIANTIVVRNPPLLIALTAFVTLFVLQSAAAKLRYKPARISRYIDNRPLLLMKGEEILEKNMQKASLTHGELYAELRKAGVTQLSYVKAAVLETTGELSVLMNTDPSHELDAVLLSEVQK